MFCKNPENATSVRGSQDERQNPTKQVTQPNVEPRATLLRGKEVDKKIGTGRSSRYAKQDPKNPAYDPTFPVPVRIGANSVRYIESEVDAYIAALPRTRNSEPRCDMR